ncbi:MAG: hypothetical protein PHU59_01165 [Candidatus Omnitrophica bacterium]|nr:hypothetical protein [Candidatus Omnitrophota bacterium]
MADEKKCCEDKKGCCDPKKTLSTLLKVVLGLAFLVLGGLAILKWWAALLMIVQGCIGLFLILAGVITLAIAKE